MIHFRSNIQTAKFGLYQIYKHPASPRVYKSDINLLHGLYILHICIRYHMRGEVISVLSPERRYHILSRVSAANEGQNMIS